MPIASSLLVCPSVCFSVCFSAFLFFSLSVSLFVHLSACVLARISKQRVTGLPNFVLHVDPIIVDREGFVVFQSFLTKNRLFV